MKVDKDFWEKVRKHLYKLSKHMSLQEMIASQTAVRHGIQNIPKYGEIEALRLLCQNVLDPIRDYYNVPLIPSSGYRCLELNRKIGSRDTSQHVKGEACDFDFERYGIGNKELFEDIVFRIQPPYDQIIYEFGEWIHISHAKDGKQCGTIWVASINRSGRTSYKQINKEQIKDL